MPTGLKRYYGANYLHFITFSCYQRRPLLGSQRRRDLFLEILEQVRCSYGFVLVGYVVMPEHVHLLISEPRKGDPSVVMQVLKQRFAHRVLEASRIDPSRKGVQGTREPCHVWQRRFYDFVVWSEHKRVEKLKYMHRNPVKRGLAMEPDEWAWSSYRYYACHEAGPVLVNEELPAELKITSPQSWGDGKHRAAV